MWRAPPDTCLMGSASEQVFCVTILAQKKASNRKTFNIKVVRLVETVKISFGLASIRDRLNQTVLESSDKTNLNLTRVLNVNPSLFLVRKIQPPLIYLRGDGRLKQHQSNQSINYTFVFIYFYSLPVYLSFSFFVRSSRWRAAIHQALGASEST